MTIIGYAVPTYDQIVIRVTTDLRNGAPWTLPDTPGAIGYVLARVYASVAWSLYWFGGWIMRQVFADTATVENLERIASLYGIFRQIATPAAGNVTLSGASSTVVPAGTVLVRSDGWEYTTDANATIGGGGTIVTAATAVQRGATGNAGAGTPLTVSAPITGLDGSATSAGLTGGTDAESDDSLRTRLLARLRDAPQGGAASDYQQWTRAAVANVDRVWVLGGANGPGTVQVYFTTTAANPIPTSGQVAAAQAYIEPLAPVTALVTVSAPVALPISLDVTLGVLSGFAAGDVEAAAEALIAAFFRTVEPGSTIYLSQISAAISAAAGEAWHEITAPTSPIALAVNEVPALDTVNWS
jgi:uncharacterized phage protein gp47/JayE